MAGSLSTRRVVGLVERLLDEPRSRYRAKLLAGDDWREILGWGPSEYLTVALINALQVNTTVTAAHGSGRKPKEPKPFYQPPTKQQSDTGMQPETADEFLALEALMNGGD